MSTTTRRQRRIRRRRRHLATGTAALVAALAVAASTLGGLPAAATDTPFSAGPEEAVADIQAFWTEALPSTYGRAYDPIPPERVHPYSSADPPPGCGTRGTMPYREVAGNAFYCPVGDFVAYDVERLVPALRERHGDVAVALVLAHEWGHAVQARVGAPRGAFVLTELQADCFAGAWARRVARGEGTALRMSEDDLDRALAGFVALRDPTGVDGAAHGAHGNAFDRVSALQRGLVEGVAACRDYDSDPPLVTAAAYRTYAERATNGDLPLGEVLPMLRDSLDAYWAATVPDYDGAPRVVGTDSEPQCRDGSDGGVLSDTVLYCPATDTIVFATETLERAADGIGDLGAGVFLAAAWASAVQADLGWPLGTPEARERAECLTGAWAGAVERGTASGGGPGLAFSPGDLDEVVLAFVATDGAQSEAARGSVFDRVRLFRTGFDEGPRACLTT